MAKIVKGEERGRPGKYIVDYRENGKRKWLTCNTLTEAREELKKILVADRPARYCTVDQNITLSEYGDAYIASRRGFLKERSVECHTSSFVRVKAHLGDIRIKDLTPGIIIKFLENCKNEGLKSSTVRCHLEVLSLVLNRARIDGVIANSPALGVGKYLRVDKASNVEAIKAFTLEQRVAFIEAAKSSPYYTLYRFLLGTGARLGEALALRVSDVSTNSAVIDETYTGGLIGSPKSGKSRTVDLPDQIAVLVRQQIAKTIEQELKQGRQADFVWPNVTGQPASQGSVVADFKRTLKRAGLPLHFTPHCTRHTFATLLLSVGESIIYVQQQLGHSSIKLTVDTYGKWIPLKSSGAQGRIESGKEVARTARQG
jgi:integrase